MSYPVKVDRKVFVPMDDGVRIALTTYLPDAPGDGPYPTVVESIPYRKDDEFMAPDFETYTYLAERGFAGVRIDIRGTGASTGIIRDEYLEREQRDTLAIFDWLEIQDWCDGNLGMWGVSWGGFSALQTAMLRPPQLRTIVPVHATHDRFACDVHYTGGSAHAAEQLDWPGAMVASNALPPDPDIFGDGWHEEWMRRLDQTPQWIFEWLRHQRRDDYWLHGSPCADYASIECPTLLIGGWLDGYVDGMVALAENLTCETRTIIGPWGHYRPATGVPAPTLDHFDLLARWFGHHLRGDDNGVMDMPPVTVFVRDGAPFDADVASGHWRAESSWPANDRTETLVLGELGHGPTTWSGPQWVGSHAPFWDRGGYESGDSTPDDHASLAFTGPPLDHDLEILGTPMVTVTVSTDREVGLVAARLVAVDPDGRGHLVCRGSRNLVFPDDLASPQTPVPGEPFEVTFPLLATSAVIPAGWRVRLSLAGADFPVVWSPREVFTLTIDPARSWLSLPVVDHRPETANLDIPPAGTTPRAPVTSLRDLSEWEVTAVDGKHTLRRSRGSTDRLPERNDLTYSSDQWWTVTVDDDEPVVHTVTEASVSFDRPGWSVSTHGTISINAGPAFETTVGLVAIHNGEEVFRREWTESIDRI
ncbi:MAG TPA: CocE/NonD family hydrolase, partial [Acidimicrobiia bacterium]